MDYDSIDWDVEAKRVARAFGVEAECRFEPNGFFRKIGGVGFPFTSGGQCLMVFYQPHGRNFCVFDDETATTETKCRVTLRYDDTLLLGVGDGRLNLIMAKGLFHLDLLSPEVETALHVNVSGHEKLEWARQYEERYGL